MKKNKLKFILCLLPLIIYICSCFVLQHNSSITFDNNLFINIFKDYFFIGEGDKLSSIFSTIMSVSFNTDFTIISLYISYLVYLQFIYICYDLIVFLPKTIDKLITRGEGF